MEQKYISLSATKDKYSISLRGEITNIGSEKLCYSVWPKKCIDISQKPVVIDQNHCLHCGRCAEICPKQVIEKR